MELSKPGSAEIVSIIVCVMSSKTHPEGCDDHPNDLLLRCTLSDIDENGYNIEASLKAVSMGSFYRKDVLYF